MATSLLVPVIAFIVLLKSDIHVNGILQPREYDFVIVGGGAAGCLLAARLSEVPDWSVVLLEAGGEENFLQDIPSHAPTLQSTAVDWRYRTEKSNSFCLGMTSDRCHWPQGKVLGGSTVINYMGYTRGNRADYDGWEALGNKGWDYDHVLPFFLKYENMTIPAYASDTKYHSNKGELVISYIPYRTQLATAYINAGLETGYKYVDYNGDNQTGYSYLQVTMKDGRRFSAYRAFLEPVRHRNNLHIVTRSMVTKILIDDKTRTAYGVEYRWLKLLPRKLHARKEVIVCAGAINSPQLLMLSGIGPKDHLQELNIPVIQDAKVGYNLQDHLTLGNLFFTVNQSVGLPPRNSVNNLVGWIDFLVKHNGTFTVPAASEAIAFEDLQGSGDVNKIELLVTSSSGQNVDAALKAHGARNDILSNTYLPLRSKNVYSVYPILLRPYSRGRIMLKDNNPFSHPLLYPNYFSDHRDVEIIIKGIRRAVQLSKTKSFQKYGADLYKTPLSPCSGHEFDSDAYWECSIRYMTFTMFHQAGTCKMGPDSDPDAVVDSALRVRGITNLRVSDASIMPLVTSGHLMATVYMIAEKTADFIKETWLRS